MRLYSSQDRLKDILEFWAKWEITSFVLYISKINEQRLAEGKEDPLTFEYTYFKYEEIIPLLACQAVPIPGSIPALFKQGVAKMNSISNIEDLKLTIEEIEALATVCVIKASQHNVGNYKSTFSGQDGVSFLTNLIENLFDYDCDCCKYVARVSIECKILKSLLDHIHVPYLFPSGMQLPKFFKDNLSDAAGFDNRSVHFGEFKREIPKYNEIDLNFNYFVKNETVVSDALCTVSFKHWMENLKIEELEPDLTKAASKSANLSLIFCNSIIGESSSSFRELCIKNRWNILRLEKGNALEIDFTAVPSDNYDYLNCIIIESEVINSQKINK